MSGSLRSIVALALVQHPDRLLGGCRMPEISFCALRDVLQSCHYSTTQIGKNHMTGASIVSTAKLIASEHRDGKDFHRLEDLPDLAAAYQVQKVYLGEL